MTVINASTHDASVWPPLDCIVFTDRAFVRTHENVSVGSRSNWNLEVLVLRRGEIWSTRRKTPRDKGENKQQTQPTYGLDAGIQTRASLVGGECSHHCGILSLLNAISLELLIFLIIFLLC